MRYVMVPVPAEHVLDVMRWVLFRTPDDDGFNDMRDRSRLATFLSGATDITRAILLRVARAALDDEPLRLSDVADDLEQDAALVTATVKEANNFALGPGREVVKVRMETAVGITGDSGKIAHLSMRPDIARLVRELAKAHGAPAG